LRQYLNIFVEKINLFLNLFRFAHTPRTPPESPMRQNCQGSGVQDMAMKAEMVGGKKETLGFMDKH
jgi:hypothetical protein